MEPVELSLGEQIDLFMTAAKAEGTAHPLWKKGAELCLQNDIESGGKSKSKLAGYLRNTVTSNNLQYEDVNISLVEKYLDLGQKNKIFDSYLANEVKGLIIINDGVSDKKVQKRLLSECRSSLDMYMSGFGEDEIQNNPKLNRLDKLLKDFDHEQIVRGGKGDNDVDLKRGIRSVLGGKMAEGIFKGIAPHKALTKGLSRDEATRATLTIARIKARKRGEEDKLADKQEKLEKAGFVRKIINRKRQNDD